MKLQFKHQKFQADAAKAVVVPITIFYGRIEFFNIFFRLVNKGT